jgi:hypothetical protein
MSYWPNKLPVRKVKTTSDSSDVEGYSQFNKGDRRPVVRALCELAPTDIEIFYQCKFTKLMFCAREGGQRKKIPSLSHYTKCFLVSSGKSVSSY